jgi:hypothetical protein
VNRSIRLFAHHEQQGSCVRCKTFRENGASYAFKAEFTMNAWECNHQHTHAFECGDFAATAIFADSRICLSSGACDA